MADWESAPQELGAAADSTLDHRDPISSFVRQGGGRFEWRISFFGNELSVAGDYSRRFVTEIGRMGGASVHPM